MAVARLGVAWRPKFMSTLPACSDSTASPKPPTSTGSNLTSSSLAISEFLGDILAHLDHGADPFAACLVAQEVGRIFEHAHAHLAGALDQFPGRFALGLRARRHGGG